MGDTTSGGFGGNQNQPPSADLTQIVTPGGVRLTVSKEAAPAFTSFLTDLEGQGYTLDQSQTGAYNPRKIAGTDTWSNHATGNAMDLNWRRNARGADTSSDLPPNVGEVAKKYGLTWGGSWTGAQRDPMHFELAKYSTPASPQTSNPPGTPPKMPNTMASDGTDATPPISVDTGQLDKLMAWMQPQAHAPAKGEQSFISLLGKAVGGGGVGDSAMDDAQSESAGRRALLNFGLGLLSQSGYHRTPVSLGEALASGVGQAQQAYLGSEELAQNRLQQAQQSRLENAKSALTFLTGLQTNQVQQAKTGIERGQLGVSKGQLGVAQQEEARKQQETALAIAKAKAVMDAPSVLGAPPPGVVTPNTPTPPTVVPTPPAPVAAAPGQQRTELTSPPPAASVAPGGGQPTVVAQQGPADTLPPGFTKASAAETGPPGSQFGAPGGGGPPGDQPSTAQQIGGALLAMSPAGATTPLAVGAMQGQEGNLTQLAGALGLPANITATMKDQTPLPSKEGPSEITPPTVLGDYPAFKWTPGEIPDAVKEQAKQAGQLAPEQYKALAEMERNARASGDPAQLREAQAKIAEVLGKQQEASQKVISDYMAKDREQAAAAYAERLKGHETRRSNTAQIQNEVAKEQVAKLLVGHAKATDNLGQLEVMQGFSDQMGEGTGTLGGVIWNGRPMTSWLADAGIGSDEQRQRWNAGQGFFGSAQKMITDLKAGQALGPQSDRDMAAMLNAMPSMTQNKATRDAMIAFLRNSLTNQQVYANSVQRYWASGKTIGEAMQLADSEVKTSLPKMPAEIGQMPAGTPAEKQARSDAARAWVAHEVQPGTFFKMPNGTMQIAPRETQ